MGEDALRRRAWRPPDDVGLGRLGGEGEAGEAVGHEVDPQQVDRQQRNREAHQRRQQQGPHLRRVAGHGVADELADVVVDPPPLPHRAHDRGEVVVQQHQVGRLPGHVGAPPPHRHPDVRPAERGRVVDAVARHRHALAPRLQRPDDGDLLLRLHPRVHPDRGDPPPQLLRGQRRELRPGADLAAGLQDAQPGADAARRDRMVARDHHYRDPGRAAGGHGRRRLGTGRIEQAHEPEECLAGLEPVEQHVRGRFGKPAHRHGDDPEPRGGHRRRLLQHLPGLERGRRPRAPPAGAPREHPLGRALGAGHEAGAGFVQRGHPRPLGGKGEFREPRPGPGHRGGVPARLAHQFEQRHLERVADHGSRLRQVHVMAQRQHLEQRGPGALAGYRGRTGGVRVVHPAAFHLHAVLGEGAGLVRADDGDRAERLDGGQVPDQGVRPDHPAGAKGQRHRDHGGEGLGNRGDRQAHGGEQHRQGRLAPEQAEQQDQHTDGQGGRRQALPQAGEPELQRGAHAGLLRQQRRDPSELGARPCGHHQPGAASMHHGGAAERQVAAVAEGCRGVRERGDGLLHRRGFAGEGRLLDPQVHRVREAKVRRDQVAGLEQDQVAGHQVGGGHDVRAAAPAHPDRRHRQGTERLERALGAVLLRKAQHRVQHQDGGDGDGILGLTDQARQHRRPGEHQDHHVGELRQQDPQRRPAPALGQAVGPVAGQAGMRLVRRQPGGGRGDEGGGDGIHRKGVPRRARHGCGTGERHGRSAHDGPAPQEMPPAREEAVKRPRKRPRRRRGPGRLSAAAGRSRSRRA